MATLSRPLASTALALVIGASAPASAPAQSLPAAQATATAVWDSAGFVVRFPRSMSPDSVTLAMTVSDNFSGYEWRVALIGDGDQALVTAFVIPPDDTLALGRYRTISEAWRAGLLRRCERDATVLACLRPARGFVRDAGGRLEIGIRDATWLRFALRSRAPRLLLVVKRDRQEIWSDEFPLVLPDTTS